VLVLDEPTSALDLPAERRIQQALKELRNQLALIIVAHRMSTLSMCDRIVVLTPGGIHEIDTPANLSKRSGFYQRAMELSRV